MEETKKFLKKIMIDSVTKIVISKPISKCTPYKKIVIDKKEKYYQASQYTEKQVFHENIDYLDLYDYCITKIYKCFRQVNAWSPNGEYMLLISKSGKCTYKFNTTKNNIQHIATEHNRKKQYILEEGIQIAPLIDMGIFTKEGKIVNSMYNKYRQINRFLEILNDEIINSSLSQLNIIDFGCGKSYLTFIVYYYLTEIMNIDANIIGLDLKEEVIKKCNKAATKYGYKKLKFEVGNIDSFKSPFKVDMVITLHACDTATDFALCNAIQWGAKMIFSVPCCQHELNKQIKTDSFSILTKYGIIKERFSTLATDAIRANLLEYCGYKTQLLEFIDFDHTPKNILIRAIKRPVTQERIRKKALLEVKTLINEFNFNPTLYSLLKIKDKNDK